MSVEIRTAYKEFPGSNVGKVVATAQGRQATVRWAQEKSSDANHHAAAAELAKRLGLLVIPDGFQSNDSGTRRKYRTVQRPR